MKKILQFKDLLQVAEVDGWTAQHVLRSDLLADMPQAEGRGNRRRFTLRQAVRLSLCSLLVKSGGLPLEIAGEGVAYCEKEIRGFTITRDKESLLYSNNDPREWRNWELTVERARYVRLWHEKLKGGSDLFEEEEFFDTKTGKRVKDYRPAGIARCVIDMTELEKALASRLKMRSGDGRKSKS